MTPDPVCRTHSARAGWTCSVCHEQLCERCTWWRPAGNDIVIICRNCEALAPAIMVPRPMASFTEMLRHLGGYPWAGDGKSVLIGGFILLGFLKLCWLPGEALSTLLMLSYLFHVVHQSWAGLNEPPGFDGVADIFDYWLVGFRASIAFGLALLPIGLYSSVIGWHWFDPFAWIFLAAGLLWAPIGLMRASVKATLGDVVNPTAAYVAVRRMGREYLIAAAVFWALVGLWFAGGSLAESITDRTGVLLFPEFVLELPRFYIAIMAARVLGIVLYTHGDDIGYGRGDDYLVPILGELLPTEQAPVREEAGYVAPVEPIELPPMSAPGVVVDTFVPYQPTADNAALEFDEGPSRSPVVVAPRPRPASTEGSEDLMPEDEFLADVYPNAPKP